MKRKIKISSNTHLTRHKCEFLNSKHYVQDLNRMIRHTHILHKIRDITNYSNIAWQNDIVVKIIIPTVTMLPFCPEIPSIRTITNSFEGISFMSRLTCLLRTRYRVQMRYIIYIIYSMNTKTNVLNNIESPSLCRP